MSRALNKKRWGVFLEGGMSPEESAELAARIRGGCEDSEDFLADTTGDPIDVLHGVHDSLFGDEAVLTDEQVDTAYADVMGRIGTMGAKKRRRHLGPWHNELPFSMTSVPKPKRPKRRGTDSGRRRVAMMGGAVVTAFLAIWLNPVADLQSKWDGAKGTTTAEQAVAPEVGMSFAVARSGKVIRPGRTGTSVSSEADLLFRFRVTGGPAYVYLVRVQGANPELVWPPAGSPAQAIDGEKDLEVDGVVQGVPMAEYLGNVHFVAVASRTLLAQPEIGPWADAGTDTVMVKVEKEGR
jgi:hypothetical protein